MLPKKNRLIKEKDFKKIHQKGKGFFSEKQNIAIRFIENGAPETRIGFSIGKVFSKKATQRNRIKRMLRESFQAYLKNIKPGFDMVVFYKKTGQNNKPAEFKELLRQTEEVLKKNNLLKK